MGNFSSMQYSSMKQEDKKKYAAKTEPIPASARPPGLSSKDAGEPHKTSRKPTDPELIMHWPFLCLASRRGSKSAGLQKNPTDLDLA